MPAFNPVTRLFPPIDYSRLDAAMAHTDQVLRETRRRLGVTTQRPSRDGPAVAGKEPAGDLGCPGSAESKPE